MLKFTSQLSDEFRRTSSLGVLKYQRSASLNRDGYSNTSSTNMYRHMSATKQPKIDNYLTFQDVQKCQNLHNHLFNHQSNRSSLNYSIMSCDQQSHMDRWNGMRKSSISRKNQRYTTPHKHYSRQTGPKPNQNASTIHSKNFEQENAFNENTKILTVKNSLINASNDNFGGLKYQNQHLKKNQYSSNAVMGSNNNYNMMKNHLKIKNGNVQAAKLRMESINTLENLRKKIQSTLGYQRSLKI